MTRLLKTLALAAAIVMLAVPGFAQMGGIKEPNLSPELDLLVNQGISVYNSTGSTITAGTLVYVCGYTETATGYVRKPNVCAASNATAGTYPKYIMSRDTVTASYNQAVKFMRLTSVNTFGAAVGDAVYASTAGGWTLTKPTPPSAIVVVGRVAAISASVGQIQLDLRIESEVKSGLDLAAGAVSPDKQGLTIKAGTNLAAGDLVYLSSFDAASGYFVASLSDSNVAGAQAEYVATGAITSAATGLVYKGVVVPMVTTGSTVGNPVYLSTTGTTGNTMTLIAPTGTDDRVQIIGRVTVVTTTPGTGRVAVDLSDFVSGVATNEIQAKAITTALLGDLQVTSAKIASATITGGNIAATTVTGSNLVNNTITRTQIANSTIRPAQSDLRFTYEDFKTTPTSSLSTGAAVSGGDTTVDILSFRGSSFEMRNNGIQTPQFVPIMTASGLNIGLTQTSDIGIELTQGITTGSREAFTVGTDAAFYFKATATVADVSGADPYAVCFMTAQTYQAVTSWTTLSGYGAGANEVICIGLGLGSGSGTTNVIHTYSKLDGGGAVDTALTTNNYQWTDAESHSLEIDVSAAGVVTFKVDGATPGGVPTVSFTAAKIVVPILIHIHSADLDDTCYLTGWEVGLQ